MNTLSLAKSRIETLPLGRAQLVECVSGTLWVTVDAQPEDIVLEAGERFVAPAGERTLVYALSDAQLRVGPLKSAEKAAEPEMAAMGQTRSTARRAVPWPGRLRPALGLWSALRQLGV